MIQTVRDQCFVLGAEAYKAAFGAYNSLSENATKPEFVLALTKAIGELSHLFGSGIDKSSTVAITYLDGWNALMTLPKALKETVVKISDFISERGETIFQDSFFFLDCLNVSTGMMNTAYDAGCFLEKELLVPAFEGISDMGKTLNVQLLAIGASSRFAIALEKVVSYVGGKESIFSKHVLDLVKNGSDFAFAVLSLNKGSELALAQSSALSAVCKLASFVIFGLNSQETS